MATSSLSFTSLNPFYQSQKIHGHPSRPRPSSFSVQSKGGRQPQNDAGGGQRMSRRNESDDGESQNNVGGRRIWRRRKLKKKDVQLGYEYKKLDRVPFYEEQMRFIQQETDGDGLMNADVEKLALSWDSRFAFVRSIIEEANELVKIQPEQYYGGAKKVIPHVISNRMNDYGFYRPDAYLMADPLKPGVKYHDDNW